MIRSTPSASSAIIGCIRTSLVSVSSSIGFCGRHFVSMPSHSWPNTSSSTSDGSSNTQFSVHFEEPQPPQWSNLLPELSTAARKRSVNQGGGGTLKVSQSPRAAANTPASTLTVPQDMITYQQAVMEWSWMVAESRRRLEFIAHDSRAARHASAHHGRKRQQRMAHRTKAKALLLEAVGVAAIISGFGFLFAINHEAIASAQRAHREGGIKTIDYQEHLERRRIVKLSGAVLPVDGVLQATNGLKKGGTKRR